MSERKVKQARKAARKAGEYTGKPRNVKGGDYLVPQWPNRKERRHPHAS